MIHITEYKLKSAIQISLASDEIYTKERESKLIHNIKALSIPSIGSKRPTDQEIERAAVDCNPHNSYVRPDYHFIAGARWALAQAASDSEKGGEKSVSGGDDIDYFEDLN